MHTKYFSNFLTNIFGFTARNDLLIPVKLLKKLPPPQRIIIYFRNAGQPGQPYPHLTANKEVFSDTDLNHGDSPPHKGRRKRQRRSAKMPLRPLRRSDDGRLLPLPEKQGGCRRKTAGRVRKVLPPPGRIYLPGRGRPL